MATAEVVHINYADVVVHGRQEDPRFLQRYWQMQGMYADRDCGRKVCLHEAAHALYMENSGMRNIRFLGPAILYRQETDEFISIGALADGGFSWIPATAELLFQEAKTLAAGGVAVRKILNSERAGDEHDHAQFLRMFESLPPHLRHINPEEMWTAAQRAVDADLDNEQFRVRVLTRTEEFVQQLYRGDH